MTIRLASNALVVLAGPSGSGKSTWAAANFEPNQIVSSDQLRSVVGQHIHDLAASADAFALVEQIVERRLTRGLITVIDSLGMDRELLDRWLAIAATHDVPPYLVRFDEPAAVVRKRNRSRASAVPSKVLTAQLARWEDVRDTVGEGFEEVHSPDEVVVVAKSLLDRPAGPVAGLRFGLSISAWDWPGDNPDMANRLGEIASEAEHAGFDSIWVMDHFMQIPQVGRDWEPMLEAYTALAWLAGRTSRVRIGTLVTCVTHRNLAHLGKIIASLDVLSGGRAIFGLGAGWYEREHTIHGYRFPPLAERYELLEDALQFLPLQWGPGTPPFEGHHFSTPEARCYPRPLQERIPLLVGGSGEQKTLRLVAQYADACNLFGEPDVVRHKIDVLHQHCADLDRDPTEIEITHLSPILCAPDGDRLRQRVDELRPASVSAHQLVEGRTAGTVEEHTDRFGRLAEAGVDTAIVSLADVGYDRAVADFAPVIEALRG